MPTLSMRALPSSSLLATSPVLHPQGLWAALAWQAQAFADERADLHCLWSMEIAHGLSRPEGALATAVFRIFCELLSNVARHAQASRVEIRISATASDLTLRVRDNGRGAPPSAFDGTGAGGVRDMREHAGHFGGWLHIDSHLDEGTTVILTMPLYGGAGAFCAPPPAGGPRP